MLEQIHVTIECATHGPQSVERYREPGGKAFPSRDGNECPECWKEVRQRKEQAREEVEKQETISRLLSSALLPARYQASTFRDFTSATLAQRRALGLVQKFGEAVVAKEDRGAWLVLSGMPGTGKTLLSAALGRYLAENLVGSIYTTQAEIAREFRESYKRGAEVSEAEIFETLSTRRVLIIDEVGAAANEHAERLLFEICDERYRELRPTVFATNHARKDLPSVIGDRLYDRMCEVAAFAAFDWKSFRGLKVA